MTSLEQTLDLASLEIDVDVHVAGSGGQTRDGLDIGSQGVEVAGTGGHANVTNGDLEACGRTLESGVVRQ